MWKKSSYSNGASACVEVEFIGPVVRVRNSNLNPSPVIVYTYEEWDAFLKGAKAGEFDVPAS